MGEDRIMCSNVLCFVLLFAGGARGFKSGFLSAPSSIDKESDYYPCFRDLNCALGIEAKTRIKTCFQLLQEKGLDVAFQWIKEASRGIVTSNDIDKFQEKFCAMEEYLKKEGFTVAMKKIFDYFMTDCNGESNPDTCENIQEVKNCINDIFDENIGRKKCGYLVDLQNGKLK